MNMLLIDTMNLTDSQKTILKSSFSYLEDLLINSPSAQLKLPQKLVEIGSYTFIYETATDYSHRIISGQEVIDWIIKNNFEDVSIFCSEADLYVSMKDVDDPNHYRESRLNWNNNSFAAANNAVKQIIAVLNEEVPKGWTYSRKEMFERYDKPHMKALSDGSFTTCEYVSFNRVPENYHLLYDDHYHNFGWEKDTESIVWGKLIGYDPSESADSPYAIGSTSIMDEIEQITY